MQMQQARTTRRRDAHESAWIALQTLAPVVRARIEKALKAAGLGPLEWYDVLWALERAGPQRQRDLALHLLLERYSLSRLIDRLEKEKLVERKDVEGDLRGQTVALTDRGREMRSTMWKVYSPAIQETMGKLTSQEAGLLTELLAKLA